MEISKLSLQRNVSSRKMKRAVLHIIFISSLCFQSALGFSTTTPKLLLESKNQAQCFPKKIGNVGLYATKLGAELEISEKQKARAQTVEQRNIGDNETAQDDELMNTELLSSAEVTSMDTVDQEELERTKNTMLFLCWGVALLSALDRVAMSVALVPISAELGYTDSMKGAVSSLFSVGYGLAIVPAGIIVATASPRIVMACGITVWSFATIATPHAAAYSSMIPLLLARASVGAAESVVLPTLQTLLSSWTTAESKGKSLATVFSGFHAGTVLAYLLSPLVIEYLGGWRELFLVYGGVGLFWLIPWLAFAKDSPSDLLLAKKEIQPTTGRSEFSSGTVIDTTATSTSNNFADSAALTVEEPAAASEWAKSLETLKAAPWGDFVRSKGAWAMLLAHAANNWGLYNNLAWSPTFYSEQYGLNVRDSALFSVLPSVAGAVGGFFAGSVADKLLKDIEFEDQEQRDREVTKVRKTMQGLALFGPALALLTLSSHIPEQPWVAQLLLMGTTGLMAFNSAGYLSANQEKAGEKWAGLLYSMTSLPAVMTGTFGVYLTGQILDYTSQDWSLVFALNAGIDLLGATAFVALYDSKREFD